MVIAQPIVADLQWLRDKADSTYEGRLLLAFRDLMHNAKAQHGHHNASRLWVDLQVSCQRIWGTHPH